IAATRSEPLVGEAFATIIAQGGEFGLDALLADIVAKRDALRAFVDETRDNDGRYRALVAAFGFNETDTAETSAGAVLPDAYFDEALGRAIGARAAVAGKVTAMNFAADLAAAMRHIDPVERLTGLRTLFLRKQTGGAWSAKSASRIMSKGVGEHFPD